MKRKAIVLVVLTVLLLAAVAAVRASSWTPAAPAPLRETAWSPTVGEGPTSWQTLDHVAFAAGGGSFVAELQGFRELTSGAEHSFVVRIVRTGGDEAALLVVDGVLDSSRMRGVDELGDRLDVRFGFFLPGPGNYSLAAELDLRAWRPAAWGYVEVEPVDLLLRADLTREDAA